ncbi:DNA-directed RNA polymerase I subunit RPA2 [Eupeodes corollae]|uniref:DNA-directed RNA polymerase I subunit RPA2 n=1 Tax=Eupeodes corollae TaxID=290404 RepID=UPI0024929A9C|nr:DNA-directed RNA polymerase I subunit RPA2 [Eupeodes corollae]
MKTYPTLTNSRPEFKKYPPQLNEHLANLGAPHLDSFNEMLRFGLKNIVKHMVPVSMLTKSGEKLSIWLEDLVISRPSVPMDFIDARDRNVYPSESRQNHISYSGVCSARIGWSINGLENAPIDVDLGKVPIMIKSKACNLGNLNPKEMVARGEHDSEWGGYFIIKGNEKIIRMLMMARRNYPIAVKRSVWKDRGQGFSDIGIILRSVRCDELAYNNVLHFLNNGTAKLMFAQLKTMSYVPICLILKALVDYTDEEIYNRLVRGYEDDQYYKASVQTMLREVHAEGIHSHIECKDYLGEIFRSKFTDLPEWTTAAEVTEFILNERILVHLDSFEEKFDMLVFMVQKLFACVQGKFKIENIDSVMMQEVLLSGHLYQKYLMDRIEIWMYYVKKAVLKKVENGGVLITPLLLQGCFRTAGNIERPMESFLATGNAPSKSGMGLMQNTGLVVMAENINRMRYMSHFRAVHRGSYFTTMRTTEARQLLPDAWGFICPVHTPDGTPCGLLNHLTVTCKISTTPPASQVKLIPKTLVDVGLIPLQSPCFDSFAKLLVVFLDGKLIGHIRQVDATKIVDKLRCLKIDGTLPQMMEIAYIPPKKAGQFPGLFLFCSPARMMRPVKNLALGKVEYIGSLEQVYMEIAVDEKEAYPGVTTHIELSKTDFMSNLANLIPMPDLNQSPRNMYQCQMGKQTMGTPCLNWPKQAANKLYRLQTPATPLFRPVHHDNIGLDDFAMGTNAVVAVISYTGYDMEDAMIINKAAHERGFAYGSIYKSKFVELKGSSYFARDPNNPELTYLDNDGLPQTGTQIKYKQPLYCYFDNEEFKYKVTLSDEKEDCVIDSIRYCGSFKTNPEKMICLTIRVARPPNIGDKFASRAGQKGICSQKYPAEDLPFSETGLIPDIVFNPHGFPSRMTIAMMVETMAGKSAALHGLVHDATPFRFSEKNTAIDYFGKLLEMGGYNYHGTERLYSGIDGREMNADIFFGVVHYQRLRHMVFDKWQVRATGPIDAVTQQPIKGRKRGGGVRFGEMERDALISHGCAFLLQDRLFHNSDKSYALACDKCGSILAPTILGSKESEKGSTDAPKMCRICGDSKHVGNIELPFSYRYLVSELSSVNINARLKIDHI